MADDLERLLAGDRRAHHLLDILGVTYFQGIHGSRSKSRKVREGELAAMDVHAAQFSAPMQGRKHLAGVEKPLGIEGAFDPLLLVEIDLAEHFRHQVALFNADAVLAG